MVLALGMVACNIRQIHWGWPLAALSSVLYGLLFWHSKLYGQVGLQALFVLLSLWGWAQWLGGVGAPAAVLKPRHLNRRGRLLALAWAWALWLAIAVALAYGSDSRVPWSDAGLTAFGVVAQVLLGRKFIDSWFWWLGINSLSVVLFALQGLVLTALLYAVLGLLSIVGWCAWVAQNAALKAASDAASDATPNAARRQPP